MPEKQSINSHRGHMFVTVWYNQGMSFRAVATKSRQETSTFRVKQKQSRGYIDSSPAFTLTETLIIGALFGIFIVVGTFILSTERARSRDAERVADMTRLAGGFALLYAEKASFADAATGCSQVGVNAATCTLRDIVQGLDAIKDPGRYSYKVTRIPDRDDFGISFHLERRYGSLLAGMHTLSKAGIQ
ncbi:MAG: hypothetical protein HY092_01660 [Candidatus Kerfeldbacteria bacterium]|nr:hypothetical protein [Candidatus Kerfeldbacteria bacterium]